MRRRFEGSPSERAVSERLASALDEWGTASASVAEGLRQLRSLEDRIWELNLEREDFVQLDVSGGEHGFDSVDRFLSSSVTDDRTLETYQDGEVWALSLAMSIREHLNATRSPSPPARSERSPPRPRQKRTGLQGRGHERSPPSPPSTPSTPSRISHSPASPPARYLASAQIAHPSMFLRSPNRLRSRVREIQSKLRPDGGDPRVRRRREEELALLTGLLNAMERDGNGPRRRSRA